MSGPPVRVVKVGGSLFDLPHFGQRLTNWFSAQTAAQNVVIAGGGKLVDILRRRHDAGRLSDREAHWRAISVMSDNARWLADLLPGIRLATELSQVRVSVCEGGAAIVFDPESYLRHEDPRHPDGPLPDSWDVTSDSIAARVADVLQADELVLLKSTLSGVSTLPCQWAKSGIVDALFGAIASSIKNVRIDNLSEL